VLSIGSWLDEYPDCLSLVGALRAGATAGVAPRNGISELGFYLGPVGLWPAGLFAFAASARRGVRFDVIIMDVQMPLTQARSKTSDDEIADE
jgi:hypothetical protein